MAPRTLPKSAAANHDFDDIPSLAWDDDQAAPTKVGQLSAAHVKAMMRSAEAPVEPKKSGLHALKAPGPVTGLARLDLEEQTVAPTAILPAEKIQEALALEQGAAHGVNAPSSGPQLVARQSTFEPPVGSWEAAPPSMSGGWALSCAPLVPSSEPPKRMNERQLAMEVACGAMAFLAVLLPSLYFLFR